MHPGQDVRAGSQHDSRLSVRSHRMKNSPGASEPFTRCFPIEVLRLPRLRYARENAGFERRSIQGVGGRAVPFSEGGDADDDERSGRATTEARTTDERTATEAEPRADDGRRKHQRANKRETDKNANRDRDEPKTDARREDRRRGRRRDHAEGRKTPSNRAAERPEPRRRREGGTTADHDDDERAKTQQAPQRGSEGRPPATSGGGRSGLAGEPRRRERDVVVGCRWHRVDAAAWWRERSRGRLGEIAHRVG